MSKYIVVSHQQTEPYSRSPPSANITTHFKCPLAETQDVGEAQIRLYISPLNTSLSATILSDPTLRESARNITYHTLETFPENSYGYITFPVETAKQLRQKLNGSYLKGTKMRVEEARDDQQQEREEKRKRKRNANVEDGEALEGSRKKTGSKRDRKKVKNEDGVLPAVELADDRQVKRGWDQTESKKNKKKHRDGKTKEDDGKSETNRSTMVFRTELPANVASNLPPEASRSSKIKDKKEKKSSKTGRMKKEVKEFEKTTNYPTFLRDGSNAERGKQAASYESGKGWVDEEGNVVEAAKPRRSRRKHREAPLSEEESAGEEPNTFGEESQETAMAHTGSKSKQSPTEPPQAPEQEQDQREHKEPHPLESLFKKPLQPSTKATSRQRPTPAPIKTSFHFFDSATDTSENEQSTSAAQTTGNTSFMNSGRSFFSSDHNDERENEEDDENEDEPKTGIEGEGKRLSVGGMLPPPPHTPFTRKDLELRRVRSPAPTPDTAAIGGRFIVPWKDDSGIDTQGDDSMTRGNTNEDNSEQYAKRSTRSKSKQKEKAGGKGEREQNAFEKHFYEHRGEYNRAFKQRRREARKDERQSANRRKGVGR